LVTRVGAAAGKAVEPDDADARRAVLAHGAVGQLDPVVLVGDQAQESPAYHVLVSVHGTNVTSG
jgi:hypothetical protein